MLRNLVIVVIVVFVVMWVIASPGSAGDSVHTWINGIITFFRHVS